MSTVDSVTSAPNLDAIIFQRLHPKAYLERFLTEGVRPDGRRPDNWRDIKINVGSISTADGSALVRLGDTTVVCGVKAEIAEPEMSRPNDGFIVPNVDLPALCSPKFKPGPPGEEAQIISERVNDMIIASKIIPTSSLCIHPGKAVWAIYVDITCINYDGNAFDACSVAVTAALQNTRLPKPRYNEDNNKVTCSRTEKVALELKAVPLAFTFGVFDSNQLISDPTAFEEPLLETIISIVLNGGSIVSMQQVGVGQKGSGISQGNDHIGLTVRCIEMAKKRQTEVTKLLIDK